MTYEENYFFDLTGFLHIKGLISDKVALQRICGLVDELELEIRANVDKPPFHVGHYGLRYHMDEKKGYASYRSVSRGGGEQLVVDDFLNIHPVFDHLVGHERMMSYVNQMILGSPCIRSTELRYRYPGNLTPTHMGGVIDARNRYVFHGRPVLDTATGRCETRNFELTVVRVLIALHEITMSDGPLCVVPGSHKGNLPSPYSIDHPENEPFMFGLPMQAGDAIIFSENTRHGGLPNVGQRVRKTIHLGFQPTWTNCMCPAHFDSTLPLSEETWNRLSAPQKKLFAGTRVLKSPALV